MLSTFPFVFLSFIALLCAAQARVVLPDPASFIANYERARNRLRSEVGYARAFTPEIAKRIGWSSAEDRASSAIADLRRRIVLQPGYQDEPWEAKVFLRVREKIEATPLYEALRRMPKGAILHLHSAAMGDSAAIVKMASKYGRDGRIFFVTGSSSNVSASDYFVLADSRSPPPGYIALAKALAVPEVRKRVMEDIVLSAADVEAPGNVWRFFEAIFWRVQGILAVPDMALAYFENAFRYLVEVDGVSHVELRICWTVENEGIPGTKENTVLRALAAVNNGTSRPRLTFKAIWSDSRHISDPKEPSEIQQDVAYVGSVMARAAASGIPSRLVGFDLVSEEDTGSTSHAFLPQFAAGVVEQGGHLYPTFFFHDGESDLPPSFESLAFSEEDKFPVDGGFNNNLLDAYLINTMMWNNSVISRGRVGHGIELYKLPELAERYRKAGIAIELCPISNQLLHYMTDIREHPGQAYLSLGLPVSLSPDDPAIFGYQGVTFDFWEATVAWNLDLKSLKLLAFYSLEYSALSAQEKEERVSSWLVAWDAFIQNLNKMWN